MIVARADGRSERVDSDPGAGPLPADVRRLRPGAATRWRPRSCRARRSTASGCRTSLRRTLLPVRNTRAIGKRNMVLNDALPAIEIDPERYTVTIDGERIEPQAGGVAAARAAVFSFLMRHVDRRPDSGSRCSARSRATTVDRRAADERARSPPRPPAGRGARRRACSRWNCRPARSSIPGQLLTTTRAAPMSSPRADEDVLVIRPRDLAEAARVGHLIGNIHRDIEADGERGRGARRRGAGRTAAPRGRCRLPRTGGPSTAARRENTAH